MEVVADAVQATFLNTGTGHGGGPKSAINPLADARFAAHLPGYRRVTSSNSPKGGQAMPMGKERTKEQLYSQAKRLGIKGRSKMNKGQLKAALSRRGH